MGETRIYMIPKPRWNFSVPDDVMMRMMMMFGAFTWQKFVLVAKRPEKLRCLLWELIL